MPDGIPTFEESIMPRSTIKACAKTVLHNETAIQKDALTALAKGSSVFISYLTTNANEIALGSKRKTIMPEDVFKALKEIEFERFIPELRLEYERVDAEAKEKRERKKSGALEMANGNAAADDVPDADTTGETSAKRPRIEDGIDTEMVDINMDDGVAAGQETEEEGEDVADAAEDDSDVSGEEEEEEGAEETDPHEKTTAPDTLDEIQQDAAENAPQEEYDEALDNGDDSDG